MTWRAVSARPYPEAPGDEDYWPLIDFVCPLHLQQQGGGGHRGGGGRGGGRGGSGPQWNPAGEACQILLGQCCLCDVSAFQARRASE